MTGDTEFTERRPGERVGMGFRTFLASAGLGVSAELSYFVARGFAVGAQAGTALFFQGREYCTDCKETFSWGSAFGEYRAPVSVLTPYARLGLGYGVVEFYRSPGEYGPIDRTHPTVPVQFELGLDLHTRGGFSTRPFVQVVLLPGVDSAPVAFVGIQIGAEPKRLDTAGAASPASHEQASVEPWTRRIGVGARVMANELGRKAQGLGGAGEVLLFPRNWVALGAQGGATSIGMQDCYPPWCADRASWALLFGEFRGQLSPATPYVRIGAGLGSLRYPHEPSPEGYPRSPSTESWGIALAEGGLDVHASWGGSLRPFVQALLLPSADVSLVGVGIQVGYEPGWLSLQ